jgi:hypothetical protein
LFFNSKPWEEALLGSANVREVIKSSGLSYQARLGPLNTDEGEDAMKRKDKRRKVKD